MLRQRLAVGVVEMAADLGERIVLQRALHRRLHLGGVPTPMVSATPQCSTPMSFISRTTRSTSSGATSPWYGQPSAHEIAPRTLMPCSCAAVDHRRESARCSRRSSS